MGPPGEIAGTAESLTGEALKPWFSESPTTSPSERADRGESTFNPGIDDRSG